jgi:eukaryotic-like serine/threonine-protein kinase
MPLSIGDKLGPYEILAPIGKGGMGEVWKAHDPRLNRDVAIKVSAAQFSERFEREAKAIAALNHPNICQIYDVGLNYLVMEYVEGTPLKGPLPVDQALKYAVQICSALDAAHKKNIIHRDLKPANILATKTGIKLLDFGLAKLGSSGIEQAPKPDDATLTMALTGKNEIVGTLYSNAAFKSRALCHRSSGSFSKHRFNTRSSATGAISATDGAGRSMMAAITLAGEEPSNARLPVSTS